MTSAHEDVAVTDLTWAEIAARFGAATHWWVATSGPGGPHSVPVWGVVVEEALLFYGERSAVRSRNLADDPRVVVHLESGDTPLIVRGTAKSIGAAADHVDAVHAYAAKYYDPSDSEYLPDAPGMTDVLLFVVEPRRALTWDLDTFEGSQRRWTATDTTSV